MLGIFFKKIDLADKETHIFHFFLSLTTFLYLISSFITVLHNGQRSPNHYYLWVNIFFSSSKMKGREFMSWEFYPYNLWQLSVKLESFFQELTFLAVKKKKIPSRFFVASSQGLHLGRTRRLLLSMLPLFSKSWHPQKVFSRI